MVFKRNLLRSMRTATCWDAFVGSTLQALAGSTDALGIARAVLAFARSHRETEAAILATRLRELVPRTLSGTFISPNRWRASALPAPRFWQRFCAAPVLVPTTRRSPSSSAGCWSSATRRAGMDQRGDAGRRPRALGDSARRRSNGEDHGERDFTRWGGPAT